MRFSSMLLALATAAALQATSSSAFAQAADTPYQASYVQNVGQVDPRLTFANSGASSTTAAPQNGTLCANVYAQQDGVQVACCSCVVPPGSMVQLSMLNDLLRFASARSGSFVVKAMAASAQGGGTTCNATKVGTGANTLATGMLAWRSTGGSQLSELSFTPSTLSAAELTALNNGCTALGARACNGACGGIAP